MRDHGASFSRRCSCSRCCCCCCCFSTMCTKMLKKRGKLFLCIIGLWVIVCLFHYVHDNKWARARSLGVALHFNVWSCILSMLGLAATSASAGYGSSSSSARMEQQQNHFATYMTDFSEGALWRTTQLGNLMALKAEGAGTGSSSMGMKEPEPGVSAENRLNNINSGGSNRGGDGHDRIKGRAHLVAPAVGGCVWDVGANNGLFYSNSYYLVASKRMHAWLYEADAAAFVNLQQLYASTNPGTRSRHGGHAWLPASHISNRVRLFNFGLSDTRGMATLRTYPASFENTIVDDKSGQYGAATGKHNVLIEDGYLLCKQQREAIKKGLCDLDLDSTYTGGGLNGAQAHAHDQTRGEHPHQQQQQQASHVHFTVLSVDIEGSDMKVVQAAHRGCSVPSLLATAASAVQVDNAAKHAAGNDHRAKAANNGELDGAACSCKWDVLIVENAPVSRWKLYFEKLGYTHAFRSNYNDIYVSDDLVIAA